MMTSSKLLTALGLATIGISLLPAQQRYMVHGPPRTDNRYEVGHVLMAKGSPPNVPRKMDYAIRGNHRTLTGIETVFNPSLASTAFHGIQLATGQAYVNIQNLEAENLAKAVPHDHQALDVLLQSPDYYIPVIVDRYRQELTRLQSPANEVDQAVSRMETWLRLRSTELLGDAKPRLFDASVPSPADYDQRSLLQLADALGDADQDKVSASVILSINKLMTTDGDLWTLLMLMRYPFIIARRTMGGAEGTEVAVHIHDLNSTNCCVYYFYLHSDDASRTVKVAAFPADNSETPPVAADLRMLEYARLPMTRANVDSPWHLNGQITHRPIEAIDNEEPDQLEAFTVLASSIREVHRYACQLGVSFPSMAPQPTFTYTFPKMNNMQLTLSCQ